MLITEAGKIFRNTRFDEPVDCTGTPGVRFINTRHYGSSPHAPLITTGPGTILDHPYLEGGIGQRRGVLVNSADVLVDNMINEGITYTDDAQAIVGWDGTRNLKVIGGSLKASGETILFGGGTATSEANIPQDILIKGVEMSKQIEWRNKAAYGRLTAKNLFEIKNGKRITVEDCPMRNSWKDGQDGFAIVLTVQDQDGLAPWTTIQDVTIRRNRIWSVGSGVQIDGKDYRPGITTLRMKNLVVEDNEFEIDPSTFGGRGVLFQISRGPDGLTIRHNTETARSLPNSFIAFDGTPTDNMVFDRMDVQEGAYGVTGQDTGQGVAALKVFAPGCQWSNVTVHRDPLQTRNIIYPVGTQVITTF